MALLLSASLVCSGASAHAEEAPRHARLRIPINPAYVALGVATLVTGARIVAVFYAGNTIFGGRIGAGLLAIYLAHVVAEGAIYGAGAGAGALVIGPGGKTEAEARPALRPEGLREVPMGRLPLQLGSADR